MNKPRRPVARRLAAAACALSSFAAFGAEPVRLLDRLGTVLQRIVPAPDGALAVVSEGEVDVVAPRAAGAGWRSQAIAVASDAQMFAAAWPAADGWWIVRQDSQDEAHTLWNLALLGPVQAGGGKPKAKQAPAAVPVRGCLAIDAGQVARDARSGRWLARVAGEQAGDRGALRAFDARGASDPRFDAAAARALGALAPAAFTAADAGGWWVSATDGPSLHERATLIKLEADGDVAPGFGEGGRVALAPSGGGLPASAPLAAHGLFDDGAGVLWATVSERAGAARHDELRAFSSAAGKRQPELEPAPALLDALWSDAGAGGPSWSGFVRNAAAPTMCVAARRPANAWSLRCIVRRDRAWQAFGEPATLAGVGGVGDIVADPRDPGRLFVGADHDGHVVALYAWKP
jgi:hypothetical protein